MLLRSDFEAQLQPGKVFFFKNPSFPEKPHPHVCLIGKEGGIVLLASATSQQATVERFIRYRGLPLNTIVCIRPNFINGLVKDTYINCNNDPHEFDRSELWEWYSRNELQIFGELSAIDFEQVVLGLLDSPLVSISVQNTIGPLLNLPPIN